LIASKKWDAIAEEIEAALGVVTVEPNYNTDGHGRRRRHGHGRWAPIQLELARPRPPTMPMTMVKNDVENEQIVAAVGRQHRRHRG
jgi:hypothetical protein